ncbi:MAG TPA: hypothetical protein VG796_29080 [Verrucomicrobiales bacterium]|jgi:hypothetical protein|nr:hypothetical protein [Verrucomicrobiales bacterium]
MADNRRQFIRRGGMLLGAAALGTANQSAGAAGVIPVRSASGIPGPVSDFLLRCGARETFLKGRSALSTANPLVSVDLVAVAADPALFFQRVTRDMPFENPYGAGGHLTFSREGLFFNVECMGKKPFGDLKAKLSAAEGIHFAHEGLLQPVSGGPAFDPWGVFRPGGRTLRMVGSSDLPPAEKIAALITALVDGALYKLQPLAAMTRYFDQTLAGLPASDAEATAVADEVTARVNQLALFSRPSSTERLFTSPLVSTSLERTFGRSGAEVLASVRSLGASGTEPGAPWLLSILGAERLCIRQGAVWIQDADRHSFLQTKSALTAARSLAATLS